jgi:hypothetical protein
MLSRHLPVALECADTYRMNRHQSGLCNPEHQYTGQAEAQIQCQRPNRPSCDLPHVAPQVSSPQILHEPVPSVLLSTLCMLCNMLAGAEGVRMSSQADTGCCFAPQRHTAEACALRDGVLLCVRHAGPGPAGPHLLRHLPPWRTPVQRALPWPGAALKTLELASHLRIGA